MRRRGWTIVATGEQQAFAVLLQRHRINAGLTQEELAERSGLSVRGISDLERAMTRSRLDRARDRSELWFNEYVAQEHPRSLPRLRDESEHICAIHGWGKPPSWSTITLWSSKFGWDRRAKQADVQALESARRKVLEEKADLAKEYFEKRGDRLVLMSGWGERGYDLLPNPYANDIMVIAATK